jgi:hypothetical protein
MAVLRRVNKAKLISFFIANSPYAIMGMVVLLKTTQQGNADLQYRQGLSAPMTIAQKQYYYR